MPNLHDLERRINSVSSTKQITRTMEMVAAAKIRRANERAMASTPYTTAMAKMLANVAHCVRDSKNALLQKHSEIRNVLVMVVVSDRGLAGGFNSNVLRYVDHLIKDKQLAGATVHIVACGKKAVGYYTYRKVQPVLSFTTLSADPTMEEAASVAAYAIGGYTNGDIDEVIMIYNHAKNAAEQQLREVTVLPVDTEKFAAKSQSGGEEAEKDTKDAKDADDVIFEPSAAAILDLLLPAYVRTTFYHALLDSAAAEQGARRNAMMSATDNATEMIETLTRLYNRVRQGAITTEISEIVGGAAALED